MFSRADYPKLLVLYILCPGGSRLWVKTDPGWWSTCKRFLTFPRLLRFWGHPNTVVQNRNTQCDTQKHTYFNSMPHSELFIHDFWMPAIVRFQKSGFSWAIGLPRFSSCTIQPSFLARSCSIHLWNRSSYHWHRYFPMALCLAGSPMVPRSPGPRVPWNVDYKTCCPVRWPIPSSWPWRLGFGDMSWGGSPLLQWHRYMQNHQLQSMGKSTAIGHQLAMGHL